ncbi:MAG TPA: ATP-binding protein [Kofleriaceae bacterium]|nr:ATP-binding protein [Kofleriaceae bacterium]
MRRPPAIIHLRRAQLVLMLAVMVPTVLLIVLGIIMLAAGSSVTMIAIGALVVGFTATGLTGYILGSIWMNKGASLARVQNDFFSSVSHELRTPVTSIRLLLESLAGDRLPPADREKVISLLAREVTRLDALLARTLELSRFEAGRHPFDLRPIAVADLASDAIAAFDASTLAAPTTIQLALEPDLQVVCDRETMARALVNLLVNAWKYSDGDRRITLSARAIGRKVELAVKDNGIGIRPEERERLFEVFERSQAAIDRGAPGVGLGLAIVRAIVRAHGGKVEVSSTPGAGSEFRILLQRGRPAEQHAPAAAVQGAQGAPAAQAGATAR